MCGVSGKVRPCSGLSSWFKLWKRTPPTPCAVFISRASCPPSRAAARPHRYRIVSLAEGSIQLVSASWGWRVFVKPPLQRCVKATGQVRCDVDARNSMLSPGSVASRKQGGWSPWSCWQWGPLCSSSPCLWNGNECRRLSWECSPKVYLCLGPVWRMCRFPCSPPEACWWGRSWSNDSLWSITVELLGIIVVNAEDKNRLLM